MIVNFLLRIEAVANFSIKDSDFLPLLLNQLERISRKKQKQNNLVGV